MSPQPPPPPLPSCKAPFDTRCAAVAGVARSYDWFSWELQEDWEPAPLQVFLMYYLHSTERHNGARDRRAHAGHATQHPNPHPFHARLPQSLPPAGCLRVIPRSHCQHNPLRDALDSPHNEEYARAKDLSIPAFAERSDEVDVPITAGDL